MNIKETKRINVKDLNANERFCIPGNDTIMVCQSRRTMDNMTRVTYYSGEVASALNTFEFVKVNLASIDLLV